MHYQDASGKFQNIETDLIPSAFSTERGLYTLKNKANIFTLRFGDALLEENAPEGEQADISYPISLEFEGKSLSFAFKGGNASVALQGENPLEGTSLEEFVSAMNGVVYREVYPNVDMVYLSLACGIKEYIVLKAPTDQTEYSFDLSLQGISPVENEDGGYMFVDGSGKTVFEMGGLFAVDANGAETSGVSCDLVQEGNQYVLRLEIDEDYLSDPDRAWPVMIDPTVMVTGSSVTFDSFVSRAYPNNNYNSGSPMPYLYTGKTAEGNYELCYSYIRFNMPSGLDSSCIDSAYIRLKKIGGLGRSLTARRNTAYWSSNTITWNNKPTYSSENVSAIPNGSSWYQFDVSGMVPNWISGFFGNYGVVILDSQGTGLGEYTKLCSSDYGYPYRPELVINYTLPPSTIYGNRPFQLVTSDTVNCGGYALNVAAVLDDEFGMDRTYLYQLGPSSTYDDDPTVLQAQLVYQVACVETYMTNNSISWRCISAYNSPINTSTEYRIAFRVMRYVSSQDPLQCTFDFHFWYQTNTGEWAEKQGTLNHSKIVPGTGGSINPAVVSWGEYDSNIIYYAISNY